VALERVVVEEGGHPLPDVAGLRATERLLAELEGGRAEDRIFFLLTGGASAPRRSAEGITRRQDPDHGASSGRRDIRELGDPQHLSKVSGRLAEKWRPLTQAVVPDVISDDLASIGSDPGRRSTTFTDCLGSVGHSEEVLPGRSGSGRTGAAELPEDAQAGDPLAGVARSSRAIASLQAARAQAPWDSGGIPRDMVGTSPRSREFIGSSKRSRAGARPRSPSAGGELTSW
jgi:hydroxypyruvate reductase